MGTGTSTRAALATYDDSDGKVLLLAAVWDMDDGMRSRGPYRRQWGARGSRLVGALIDVEIFPQDTFKFTSDSHVLVLAQSKRKAEEVILYLQVKCGREMFLSFRVRVEAFAGIGARVTFRGTPCPTGARLLECNLDRWWVCARSC